MDPIYLEAIERFSSVYDRAKATDIRDPSAVSLATAASNGQPSLRTVLLKGYDERGFVFYTNNQSRKGEHLKTNPRAALLFFWQTLFEQVSIEGPVGIVSKAESDAYWATRSRESCLGAWASAQSQPLDRRATLEAKMSEYTDRYLDSEVPRPPHWHGYRVHPQRIEFWQSGEHRLHNRQCYRYTEQGWDMTHLNP